MVDPQQQPQGQQPAGQQPPAQQASTLTIPQELREKHGPLIDLIVGSESMNDEERQYWINILPIMTDDQIKNLNDILTNEKQQLQAIDQKYAKEIEQIGEEQLVKRTEEERKKKRLERERQENQAKEVEEEKADAILQQIEGE